MSKTKVYFPGLNALRFFAAFAVIITHIELILHHLGYDTKWINLWGAYYSGEKAGMLVVETYPMHHILNGEIHWLNPIISEAGPLGVVFFFVLSGFLITYLLYVEREQVGTISVKHFYFRRIFRIWPLYYFLIILGFFVFPQFEIFSVPAHDDALNDNFYNQFLCYALILPNLGVALYGAVPNIGQAWSIGVEEQFYIIWPAIIKFFKKPLHAIIWVTAILLGIKISVILISSFYGLELLALKKFLAMSKIECMTIGAFGAWFLYFKKGKMLSIIYSLPVQVISLIGIPFLMFFTPRLLQDAIHLVYGVFFLVIILNVSTNKNSLLKLENKVLDLFGKISFGIYMYHLVVVLLVIKLYAKLIGSPETFSVLDTIIIYSSTIAFSLLVSWLSYEYFEKRFIKLKAKFSKVISGNEARQ